MGVKKSDTQGPEAFTLPKKPKVTKARDVGPPVRHAMNIPAEPDFIDASRRWAKDCGFASLAVGVRWLLWEAMVRPIRPKPGELEE